MSDLLHKDIFSMKEIDELNTSIASPVVSNPSKHKDKDTHTNREKKYTNVKRNRSESDEEESLSSSYEESNPYLNSEVFIEMNIIQLNMQKRYNEEFKFSNCINSVQVRCEYTVKKLFNNFAPSFATGDGYSIPISQKYRY